MRRDDILHRGVDAAVEQALRDAGRNQHHADLRRGLCAEQRQQQQSGKPEPDHRHGTFQILGPAMSAAARGEWSGEFFRVRWYKNGMGHFEFLDPELVLKLNKVLASRYPAALAHVR